MDIYSPVAPTHIHALVLPVGHIERQRFLDFRYRLQTEAFIISLDQIERTSDHDDALLDPSLFPQGCLLYRFTSAAPSEQQQQLSPFELFREPLLILGIVDSSQLNEESGEKELENAAAFLKARHPRVVHRQLLALEDGSNTLVSVTSGAISVANAATAKDPALKTAVCEVSRRFLLELSTYAQATHASPTIPTPGQTARGLQRTSSLREEERRPGSGRSTPSNAGGVASPTDQGSPARSGSKNPPMPATSFDQIQGVNNTPVNGSRPESRSSNKGRSSKRSSSQDRMSMQGFGSSTSQEKARMRGKARVGIVFGSIWMMAGQWRKALAILLEHSSKARVLQDHLWHAKGLDNMLVCMILLAWSQVDFEVPSICEPVTDRSGPLHAARIAAETKAAAQGTKQQLQLFRLASTMPALARLILGLYRSAEDSLELPFIVVAEATVRMSKLLALLGLSRCQISSSFLNSVVAGHVSLQAGTEAHLGAGHAAGISFGSAQLSKTHIADMLAQILPSADEGIGPGDQIRLTAGVASVYSILGLNRKRAATIKDLVIRLTGALIQARKVGAAEMGIHPAASLSNDIGTDALLAITEESRGINDLMADVSSVYGATLASTSMAESPMYDEIEAFGSTELKLDLLKQLAAFCEASPNPHGVLLLSSSLLKAAGPNAAVDITPGPIQVVIALPREQQMHFATVINRTVTVSRHLGLSDVQAMYWDPFLVRRVEILQPGGDKAVIDHSNTDKVAAATGQTESGNPLLYDPNASRPGTAEKQVSLLVREEASQCIITLQNPFDIPVDIEQLDLVTEGVALSSRQEPVTLAPLAFQQVSLMVTPKAVGATTITGCRIKMQSCFPQIFPIITRPWSAKASLLLKHVGLDAGPRDAGTSSHHDLKHIGLELETVTATTIDALPILACDRTSTSGSGLMLLEGEHRSFHAVLRNVSRISARIFEIKDSNDVLKFTSHESSGDHETRSASLPATIPPEESLTFHFDLVGKAGVSSTEIAFLYSTNEPDATKYARSVTVPLEMTVNAAMQVQNLAITTTESASDDDVVLVSFDIRNAWPKLISYQCSIDGSQLARSASAELSVLDATLAPGELRRISSVVPRVVAGSKYEDDIVTVKEAFLKRLQVSWQMDDRAGTVNLRSLTVSTESLNALRGVPVRLSVAIIGQDETNFAGHAVGSFVTVRVELSGHSRRSAPLSVGLSAAASEGLREVRKMAVVGTLQRLLPPIEETEEKVVEFVICPLLAGSLDMEVLVHPVSIADPTHTGWIARRPLSLSVT